MISSEGCRINYNNFTVHRHVFSYCCTCNINTFMTEGVCSVYEPDMLLNLKSENACASKYNVMLVEATQPA